MEKVQVRFPPEDLRKIEKEIEEGKYPNKGRTEIKLEKATSWNKSAT